MMRVLFIVFFLVSFNAQAAAVVDVAFDRFMKTTVGGTVAGPVTFVGGKVAVDTSVSVLGRSIPVPAKATLSTTASTVAMAAIRATPQALVIGLVASWLLDYGLQWAVDYWTKDPPDYPVVTSPDGYQYVIDSNYFSWRDTAGDAASDYLAQQCAVAFPGQPCTLTSVTGTPGNMSFNWQVTRADGSTAYYVTHLQSRSAPPHCPTGGTLSGSTCITPAVSASNADLAAPEASALPDAVASSLASSGVPMPVGNPVVQPIDVPIAEPRLDPVTNRMVQDRVRITQPNLATSPQTLRLDTYTTDAGAVLGQTTDPVAPTTKTDAVPPETKTDCDKFPNSLGCIDAGDAPAPDEIRRENSSFNVTPVTIGGTGTCHADIPVVTPIKTFTIPLKPICDALGWLRPLVIALAWFSAAVIISGAIKE